MDTSPEYIKMCEKAEEIQKAWEFKNGDFLSTPEGVKLIGTNNKADIRARRHFYIWLPRQDQLQEMVSGHLFHVWGGGTDGYSATASTGDRDGHVVVKNSQTLEQLWLAFVMKEKYNKEWTGGCKWTNNTD